MTGKNVDTLNTKSCLNMIYNGFFIPTLPDQFSFVVVGAQRFLLRCYLGLRCQKAGNIIPYSCNDPENPLSFVRFSSFHDVTSLRDATVCRCLLFCIAPTIVSIFISIFICKSLTNLSSVNTIPSRLMKFACHFSHVCKELQILSERIKLKRLIILNYVEKNESALEWEHEFRLAFFISKNQQIYPSRVPVVYLFNSVIHYSW